MKRLSLHLALALLAGASLAACSTRVRASGSATATVRTSAPPPPPRTVVATPSASASVSIQTPILGAGVTVVAPSCDPGAPESCDGIDNDCDGVIDEGCGWQSGNIQITLAWQNPADLDLYVTDPTGQTIYYRNPQSTSGGVLDHDARGGCVPGANPTVENVYYDSPRPPPGRYQIEVHYYSNCGAAGVTPATVAVAVGGEVIGTYGIQLSPQQRQTVASFDMP